MERSLFPEGVEVHQEELGNTEATKANQILRAYLDLGQAGVVDGLIVTVNTANPSTINISAGHGRVPKGELVEFLGLIGLSLADYTAAAINYVCLIYTEVETSPQAHATDGIAQNTRAVASVRSRVLTATEFAILPTTSDDMNIDALDRALVVGLVTARGAGVPLTTNSIRTTEVSGGRLLAILPNVEIFGANGRLPGVEIVALSNDTALSSEVTANVTALLRYAYANGPFVPTLSYRAPGDTTQPTGTDVTVDGLYTLTSPDSGATIQVRTSNALMFRDGTPPIDMGFTVIDLYLEPIPQGTARDEGHRRKDGGVVPRSNNPHGDTLSDLGETQTVQHGLKLGTSLIGTSAQALVPRLLTEHAGPFNRSFLWAIPIDGSATPGRRFVRFYSRADLALEVTVNARWDTTLAWNKDKNDGTDPAIKFVFKDDIFAIFGRAIAIGPWGDGSWSTQGLDYMPLAGGGNLGLLNFNEANGVDLVVTNDVVANNDVEAGNDIRALLGNIAALAGSVAAALNVTAGETVQGKRLVLTEYLSGVQPIDTLYANLMPRAATTINVVGLTAAPSGFPDGTKYPGIQSVQIAGPGMRWIEIILRAPIVGIAHVLVSPRGSGPDLFVPTADQINATEIQVIVFKNGTQIDLSVANNFDFTFVVLGSHV